MKYLLYAIILFFAEPAGAQALADGVWRRVSTSGEMEPYTTGYVDENGKIVIPVGKYVYCFTEVFDRIAVVLHRKEEDPTPRYYAIDRDENVLFQVAVWDNAPDEVREGLFRIIENGKMGFANMEGEIIIPPVYTSVFPFSEGLAAFCIGGETIREGEYSAVSGGRWGFLDRCGTIRIPAQFDRVFRSFENGWALVEKEGVRFRIDKGGYKMDVPE